MLRDGPASVAARWFDVDWAAADGKVILPVLGEPLADVVGRLTVVGDELRLGEQRWPLTPGTEGLAPADALARQHYALQWWRDPARNVRRFFTIDGLVGVRVEDPVVVAVVDTVPRDHRRPSGLRRCPRRPRRRAGRPAHVPGGVARRHRRPLAARGEDPRARRDAARGRGPSTARPGTSTPPSSSTPSSIVTGGRRCASGGWRSPATIGRSGRGSWRPGGRCSHRGCARTSSVSPGCPAATSPRSPSSPSTSSATARTCPTTRVVRRWRRRSPRRPAARPDLATAVEELAAALDEPGEWPTRWQQLTGPATAKGVEDRAFWRYVPLASLGEVGGRAEPDLAADPLAAVHGHHAAHRGRVADDPARRHDPRHGAGGGRAGDRAALATRPAEVIALAAAWLDGPGAALDVEPAMQLVRRCRPC